MLAISGRPSGHFLVCALDAKAGNSKFVMFYDQAVTSPQKVLATLVAAGESDAELVAVDPDEAVTERRWVRPVRQRLPR